LWFLRSTKKGNFIPMTTIRLTTIINAPAGRCFDLSRSVNLHLLSTKATKEKVVAGRSAGLMEKDETVTWEAIHFGIRQRLTTKIMEMRSPYYFSDQMVKGAFKKMYHEHHFAPNSQGTEMTDVFYYETPYGIFGKLFDLLILERHMTNLLEKRNETIKSVAESDDWINIL
jgi:ligand-binding SRPBCC domain-containing protein